MNRHYLTTVVSAALGSLTLCAAEEVGIFDGGWRISAGAVYSSPVRTNLRFMPSSLRPASSVPVWEGMSADEAKAKAEKGVYNPASGRTVYASGAWFAPDGGIDSPGHTWNANLPAGSYLGGGRFSLGEVAYGATSSEYSPNDIPAYGGSDSASMPGLSVELSRQLYRDEERGYGLDLALGVMYFFRDNAFNADYGYRAGYERNTTSGGSYEGTIASPDELPDARDWYWNGDYNGSYGRGGMDTDYNGGPVFDLGSIGSLHHPGGSSSDERSCMGAINARGDYRQLDLTLGVRPYYDLTNWLRVYGTIGAALSRSEFELDLAMSDNGRRYNRNADFSQWNLYGIGGVGAMLRYKDFTLAGDFLARFGDDDLTIDDRYVHGTIEQGSWMFKLMIGYEF